MTSFIKSNWKYIVLITVILFLLLRNQPVGVRNSGFGTFNSVSIPSSKMSLDSASVGMPLSMSYGEAAPVETQDRLVIKDTSLSLVVKDVSKSIGLIEEKAKSFGGFLVNSYLSRPEEGADGSIIIRVPESRRTEALDAFRQMAVKVVSESISGNDVTDEYVDLESRLDVLNQTKIKFQDIMSKATRVEDLLNVQRELINLQQQIDSIKGQQKYYEQSAKLSKISVYLSTDELSLPYAPTDTWRPAVIFKTAVRSLMTNIRSLGTAAIWLLVYSPAIVLGLVVYLLIKRRRSH